MAQYLHPHPQAFARAINPRVQANEAWSWRMSTPGLLTHAVKTYGWGFIPNQIIPPMVANVGSVSSGLKADPNTIFAGPLICLSVGAVLYTSYLQILGTLHQPSSQSTKRIFPPPPIQATLTAGLAAGAIQSVIAAPLDALQVRFRTSDIVEGRYRTMWHYGYRKLSDIGVRGIFAGWSLSLVKDSVGYGKEFSKGL